MSGSRHSQPVGSVFQDADVLTYIGSKVREPGFRTSFNAVASLALWLVCMSQDEDRSGKSSVKLTILAAFLSVVDLVLLTVEPSTEIHLYGSYAWLSTHRMLTIVLLLVSVANKQMPFLAYALSHWWMAEFLLSAWALLYTFAKSDRSTLAADDWGALQNVIGGIGLIFVMLHLLKTPSELPAVWCAVTKSSFPEAIVFTAFLAMRLLMDAAMSFVWISEKLNLLAGLAAMIWAFSVFFLNC